MIFDSDPWSINCQPEALPIVTFHFRNNHTSVSNMSTIEYCIVDMRLQPEIGENRDCIKEILKFYQSSNNVYFIWLVHGWTKSDKSSLMENHKNSYFIKYPQKSG